MMAESSSRSSATVEVSMCSDCSLQVTIYSSESSEEESGMGKVSSPTPMSPIYLTAGQDACPETIGYFAHLQNVR